MEIDNGGMDVLSPADFSSNNPFEKYGIEFIDGGKFIRGPKKPEKFAQTPNINFQPLVENIFDNEQIEFIQSFMESGEPLGQGRTKIFLSCINSIFHTLTNDQIEEYAHIIFMETHDFEMFQRKVKANATEGKEYAGINIGGLIISTSDHPDGLFPLIFHELGHSLHPSSSNEFVNEFRAFFFQYVCVDSFEASIQRFGVTRKYERLDTGSFPSEDHMKAEQAALDLYHYIHNKEGNSVSNQHMESLKNLFFT